MRHYKIEISYDGARYKGWQKLGGDEETIQGKIEKVLTEFAKMPIEIDGASRTDAGVNAICQVATFKIEINQTKEAIMAYLNRYLPDDIRINNIKAVDSKFHARFNATSKIYRYRLYTGKVLNPFVRKYVLFEPGLDYDAMKRAAKVFVGEHDFTTFTNVKSKKKTMIRRLDRLDFIKENNELIIEFEGNGFLHNMVRRIVGTLVDVGQGKLNEAQVAEMLEKKDRALCSFTAPANALFLVKVNYDGSDFNEIF